MSAEDDTLQGAAAELAAALSQERRRRAQAEDVYRAILMSLSGCGVIISRPNGGRPEDQVVAFANTYACRAFGGTLAGRQLVDLMSEENAERHLAGIRGRQHGRSRPCSPRRRRRTGRRLDGSPIELEIEIDGDDSPDRRSIYWALFEEVEDGP